MLRIINSVSLRFSLPALLAGFILVACSALGLVNFTLSQESLRKAVDDKLSFVASNEIGTLKKQFADYKIALQSAARSGAVKELTYELNTALYGGKDNEEIKNHFQPEGSNSENRATITGEGHKTLYAWKHSSLANGLYTIWAEKKLADVAIVNAEGLVIYTTTKSDDFLKTVDMPELAPIADAVKAAEQAKKSVLQDFTPYKLNGKETNSLFLAHPIYDPDLGADAAPIGTLVFRVQASTFATHLSNAATLAGDISLYFIDQTGTVVADSMNGPARKIDFPLPETDQPTAMEVTLSNTNTDVLTVTSSLTIADKRYFITSSEAKAQALADINQMKLYMIVLSIVMLVFFCALGWLCSDAIAKPIRQITKDMDNLASGKIDEAREVFNLKNEIGNMANAVEVFRKQAVENKELSSSQQRTQEAIDARRQAVERLIAYFNTQSSNLLDQVVQNSTKLSDTASSLDQLATEVEAEASSVADTMRQSDSSVYSIKDSAENLMSSISEINHQVGQTAQIVKTANEQTTNASTRISGLANAVDQIGEVVKMISDIAEQTNLLALNATIEAARAGEAGAGFAVVANEVKTLATQTTRATENIAQHISTIQQTTGDAVQAISGIGETMTLAAESAEIITAAISSQGVATKEIHSSVIDVASGFTQITSVIETLKENVTSTNRSAETVNTSAHELDEQAKQLNQVFDGFIAQVEKSQAS